MIIDNKLTEYKNNIETLQAVESLEVYRWLVSLGEKINEDPLSEAKRINKNKVSQSVEVFEEVEFNIFSFCKSNSS